MEIKLSKWQTIVWDDPSRFKVINCGRRAGKSTLTALRMITVACQRSCIVWYVAPQYKQAKAIMWEMLKELIPKAAIIKTNETELKVELKNGSQIYLKGADNPDSLRGVRIDFCIFDEVAFIDKWELVWQVIRPTLIDSKSDCWFISTPNGFNHFKDMFDQPGDNTTVYHFTTYDNPFIEKEEIDKLKEEMDSDSFEQEIMGEFRKMSGLVYKDFSRDLHMVEIPGLDGFTFYRSIDFGFDHKTALLYFAVNDQNNLIYVFDGFYKSGMTEKEMAEVIREKDEGRRILDAWADSAQPMAIENLHQLGYKFKPVTKGPDSVRQGIKQVVEFLRVRKDTGKPTLLFSNKLNWLADEFDRYRWIDGNTEVPLKRDDDAMDALRYFVMSFNMNFGKKATAIFI